MKITRVTAHNLADQVVLTRIETEAGICGVGEASPMYPAVICAILREVLEPMLVGEDPAGVERLYERMLYARPCFPGKPATCNYKLGPQGALTSAISGVEMALWDLRGKALGQPLWSLLGGLVRREVPVFASLGLSGEMSPQGWAEAARHYTSQGFRGVKLSTGCEWGFDGGGAHADAQAAETEALETVRAVRQAVGDKVEILVDAHSAYYPRTAARIARSFEAYRVGHFEEPLAAWDWESLAWLRSQTCTPIAAGEQLYLLPEFRRFLAMGAVDILQFDLTKAGGLWAGKKIAALAEAWDLPVRLHNYHSPIATAAMLHFTASTPACRYSQEIRAAPHPLEGIVRNPPRLVDGKLSPPDGPGLGLELDEERIATLEI